MLRSRRWNVNTGNRDVGRGGNSYGQEFEDEDDWDDDGERDADAGVARALGYLNGGSTWEREIIRVYAKSLHELQDNTKFPEAIAVYDHLLTSDPMDVEGPEYLKVIVLIHDDTGAIDKAAEARKRMVEGEDVAKRMRQTEHPLPIAHRGQHCVDEVGGALGHATTAATGTEAPTLSGKRDQPLLMAVVAPQTRKAAGKRTTRNEATKLALDERRQTCPVATITALFEKGEQVTLEHAAQHGALRPARLVFGTIPAHARWQRTPRASPLNHRFVDRTHESLVAAATLIGGGRHADHP